MVRLDDGGWFLGTIGGHAARLSEELQPIWVWRRDTEYAIPHYACDGRRILGAVLPKTLFTFDESGKKVVLPWVLSKPRATFMEIMGDRLAGCLDDFVEIVPLP